MAFPVVQGISNGRTTSNQTSHSVTLPSGIVAGELLLVPIAVDGDAGSSASAGWTELGDVTEGTISGAVYYKIAAGSDTLTITTVDSEQISWVAHRISGAGTPTGSSVIGDSTNPDPPNHNAGSAADYLWVAVHCGDGTTVSSAAPTNYTNLLTQAGTGSISGASISVARRTLNAASENPGTFTAGDDEWVCWTIAVPPAAATGQDIAVGQASETEASNAITPAKALPVGQAAAADSGGAVTPVKSRAIGQASETSSAGAVVPVKVRVVDQAAEADAANGVTPAKSLTVGQAVETDTAALIVPGIGVAVEADAAGSIVGGKSVVVGQAAEADSAGTVAPSKSLALQQATEADAAGAVTSGKSLAVLQAVEADAASLIVAGLGAAV
ncbi:MAG: hypothetical protein ACREX8_12770, partial [Gammaproteobacteria bacterium]